MPNDAIVYIVDDDDSVRKATSRLLKTAGFKVLAFESAEELLGYPMPESAGCLILDYQMPGRNGIELQKDLKATGIALPVVFLRGKGDIPISVTAMKQGAVDFLPKPVDDKLLVDTVRKALGRLIKAAGYDAETYESAEDFLNSSALDGSDCLILDVQLTGMSGLELQAELSRSRHRCPIVFISAFSDENARIEAVPQKRLTVVKPIGRKSAL